MQDLTLCLHKIPDVKQLECRKMPSLADQAYIQIGWHKAIAFHHNNGKWHVEP